MKSLTQLLGKEIFQKLLLKFNQDYRYTSSSRWNTIIWIVWRACFEGTCIDLLMSACLGSIPTKTPILTGLIFTVALSVKRNTRCFKGNELNGVNNFWLQMWAHKHFSIAPGIIYRTTTSGKEEWKRDHGWMAGGSKDPLNSNPLFQALLLVQSYHLNRLSLSTLCCPISTQLSKDLRICVMISNAQ